MIIPWFLYFLITINFLLLVTCDARFLSSLVCNVCIIILKTLCNRTASLTNIFLRIVPWSRLYRLKTRSGTWYYSRIPAAKGQTSIYNPNQCIFSLRIEVIVVMHFHWERIVFRTSTTAEHPNFIHNLDPLKTR